MTAVYLFSIFWLCFAIYGVYITIKKHRNDEEEDLYTSLMDMERFISSKVISKMIILLTVGVLAIDVMGFYLAYCYVYASMSVIYYRVMFFIACACVFLADQSVGMRYAVKVSYAITKLEEKPAVLQRWMSLNEPDSDMLGNLGVLTKFTMALQLFLFTVVTSLQ